jgi:hypothetical protein
VKLSALVESFSSYGGTIYEQPFYRRMEAFVNAGFSDMRGTQDTLDFLLTRSDPVRWLTYDMPIEHYLKCASCKELMPIEDVVTCHSKLLIVHSAGFEDVYTIDPHVRFSGVEYKLLGIIYRRLYKRTLDSASKRRFDYIARFLRDGNICVFDRLTETLRPVDQSIAGENTQEAMMCKVFEDVMGYSHCAELIFYERIRDK